MTQSLPEFWQGSTLLFGRKIVSFASFGAGIMPAYLQSLSPLWDEFRRAIENGTHNACPVSRASVLLI